MKPLTILIADDHDIVHIGLSAIIKKIRSTAEIHISRDFPSTIELVNTHLFDLIIMDINMPAGNFQSTLEIMKRKQPHVKVMAFSSADENLFAPRFMLQGLDGFLNKLSSETEMKNAIESILNTGVYLSPKVKDDLIQNSLNLGKTYQNPLRVLTDREMEIAALLVNGDSLKTITQKLFIHTSTASTYKTRIFQKLSIKSIPELIHVFNMYNPQ